MATEMQDKPSATVLAMVAEADALMDEVATLQEQLQAKHARLKQLIDHDIAEAVHEQGAESLALPDGRMLEIEPFYHVNVNKSDLPAAYQWLRENGLDAVIRHEYRFAFGAGETESAQEFSDWVTARLPHRRVEVVVDPDGALPEFIKAFRSFVKEAFPDRELQRIETVHPNTFKAEVKKLFLAGKDLPPCITIYNPNRASLTLPADPETAPTPAPKSDGVMPLLPLGEDPYAP